VDNVKVEKWGHGFQASTVIDGKSAFMRGR